MTNKLYYKDAYLKEIKTKVVKSEGNKILLEETIFFPQTSSEPGDLGKINEYKVVGLKKEGEEIWHNLNMASMLKVGDEVTLQLDWEKRYMMMRLHSALHLWASVFDRVFQERAVAGVVKSNTAYLVFKHELSDEIIQKALEQANKDIQVGVEIKTFDDKTRAGFKWCQIGEYDPIPCGGLQVKNSKEIAGLICKEKLLEGEKQKLILQIK